MQVGIGADCFLTLLLAGPKSPDTDALRRRVLEEFDDTVIDFFNGGGQVVIVSSKSLY